MTCLPSERNIFTPTSITIGDCNEYTRSIKIKGNWIEDRTKFPSSTSTTISFDFRDGDLIKCNYNESNSEFDCEFPRKGGNIKIQSQYVVKVCFKCVSKKQKPLFYKGFIYIW